jgi:hypothetical protein
MYTEHAGGDDQIVRDPVLMAEVAVDVSGKNGDTGTVASNVTPGVWSGIPWSVLVGSGAPSDGDAGWVHPEQQVKKMINPARTIQEINAGMEWRFIERH